MRNIFLSLLLLGVFCGCSANQGQDEFDYGKMVSDKYTNDYFGFSLKVPVGWETSTGQKINEKEIPIDKPQKTSEVWNANLLFLSKFPVGNETEFNPNIIIAAENMTLYPGVKDGKGYLVTIKAALEESNLGYYADPLDDRTEKFGGLDFSVLRTAMNDGKRLIHQNFYSIIRNKFSFTMIVTYTTPEEAATFGAILKTAMFK